jgi:cytolethal distending toxin subunit B
MFEEILSNREKNMILVTWNMQGIMGDGSSKIQDYLIPAYNEGVDVFCLQECGGLRDVLATCEKREIIHTDELLSPCFFGTLNFGTSTREKMLYAYIVEWDEDGNRCNLAILSREEPKELIYIGNPLNDKGRPVIGIRLGGIYIFTIHAFAGGGNDVDGFLRKIVDFLSGRSYPPFFLAGDFNKEPLSVKLPDGLMVISPDYPTHGFITSGEEKILDYGICSFQAEIIDLKTKLLSDHRGVAFGF